MDCMVLFVCIRAYFDIFEHYITLEKIGKGKLQTQEKKR